ncbi:MAG: GAP family protein [Acidipropionibacterium acidipropionici]|nr:GAP family protein [Acidipropionibacterium acidipropionici]
MPIASLGAVLGLAVLDMLSPALVGITIYLLLAGGRSRTGMLVGTYLVTVAASYWLLGVALVLGLGAVLPHIDETTLSWVEGGVGAVLFSASWFIPARPRRTADRSEEPGGTLTARSAALLGLGTWVFEFWTAVPYFAAVGIIASAASPPGTWLGVLGGYVLVMILPGIALYLTWLALRERLRPRLERWRSRLTAGSRSAVSWTMGIVGVLLVLDALPDQMRFGAG